MRVVVWVGFVPRVVGAAIQAGYAKACVLVPFATLDFDARQQLVRTVLERVMVEDGRVDIHFAIPLPDPPPGTSNPSVSAHSHLRFNGNHQGPQLPASGTRTHGAGTRVTTTTGPGSAGCRRGRPYGRPPGSLRSAPALRHIRGRDPPASPSPESTLNTKPA